MDSKKKEPPFRQLRIAGKRHRILWDQDLEGDCGECKQVGNVISVGRNMGPDEERESVLHEVVHAVEWQQGLTLKEEQVRQLSVGLFETLRANPKLVSYLLDESDEH